MEEEGDELMGGNEISVEFLGDTVVNLLAAWKKCTSEGISWFFWLIATNSLVGNKISKLVYPHGGFIVSVCNGEKGKRHGAKQEKWISEQGGIIHIPSYKFIAFNAGPRNCFSKKMTFFQMKIVATAIICNHHIQVVEGHPVSPSNSIILHHKCLMKKSKVRQGR
ncbi:Alkane hydroxylase MAH1 [Vitis vinifera]|uniref:Alkane hydroxylase MAH1 n=1 Tax=Vitis vinifera TaxID=29760 RepID=A0A438EFM4_VITVI|nr:Alkane hydroxylase MAH1 [Vitis vinifera]